MTRLRLRLSALFFGMSLALAFSCSKTDTFPRQQYGSDGSEESRGIVVDSEDNLYVAGFTDGSLKGDNAGEDDFFIVKYSAEGERLWTVQDGSAGRDRIMDIAVDKDDNVYVAGWTSGSLIDGQDNAGKNDIFVAKFNSNGDELGRYQMGTAGDDEAQGIDVDDAGNIYIAGFANGDLEDNTRIGKSDFVLSKFDSLFNLQKTLQFGTGTHDYAMGVSVDNEGFVYLTGYTYGELGDPLNEDWYGDYDVAVFKFSSDGEMEWQKQKGTGENDFAMDVAAGSDGNVYVVGQTMGGFNGAPNSGGSDMFLASFGSVSGDENWVIQNGTVEDDTARRLTIGPEGGIYLTGTTYGALTEGGSAGGYDVFVAKYLSNRNLVWVEQFGTGDRDSAQGISTDSMGNICLTGYTEGDIEGYIGIGVRDFFLLKYSPSGELY